MKFKIIITTIVALILSVITLSNANANTPKITFSTPIAASSNPEVYERFLRDISIYLDKTPKGGTVKIATYSVSSPLVFDHLVKAFKRGVHVQMIIDDHGQDKYQKTFNPQLMNVLNDQYGAKGSAYDKNSFVKRCKYSCMSSKVSVMHAKLYTFSSVGKDKYLSVISSANLTNDNTMSSWNNTQTYLNNKTVYDSLNKYFDDMKKDKDNVKYYWTKSFDGQKVYFYPQGKADPDPIYNALTNVKCTTKKGYGNGNRKTIIRIAVYTWKATRSKLADRLWNLYKQGCDVQVIYNNSITNHTLDQEIPKILLRKTSRGVMPVYNGRWDAGKNGSIDAYVHHKFLLINGRIGTKDYRKVYTGSANWTRNSLVNGNEILLAFNNNKEVEVAFEKHWNILRDKYSTKDTTVPITSIKDSRYHKLSKIQQNRLTDLAPGETKED